MVRMDAPQKCDEILLEITPIGSLLRVAAVDPETLTEVTFQAPLGTDQATLAALARRKLAFVKARRGRG
ncbi:MAG: hypothetical protein R3F54_01265 [Alphaproteobacteria bacterium]